MTPPKYRERALAIAILWTGYLVVGFGAMLTPRITPPGGLSAFDMLSMCGLPVVTYLAGKHWYNGPLFLLYGTAGTMPFLFFYLSDGHYGLKLQFGHSTLCGEVIGMVVGVLFIAILCDVTGRVASTE